MLKQILGLRSIPLKADTLDAWRTQGVLFRRRGRLDVWDARYHEPHIKAVLNLGNLDMSFKTVPVPVFNAPEVIRAVSAPTSLRRTIPQFLPSQDMMQPHWHKQNGFRGVGKVFHDEFMGGCPVMGGDLQTHIQGDEYRVITVGGNVVQATRKVGTFPDFDFEWVGVKGVAKLGIIPMLHEAVGLVPSGKHSVLGWDIIIGPDRPYIIEANTSPGVNEATAGRIVTMLKEIVNVR